MGKVEISNQGKQREQRQVGSADNAAKPFSGLKRETPF
jgi:hypothetical protein